MRELKTESQSNRTTQTQPGLKKSTPQTVEDGVEQHDSIELESALKSDASSPQETPAKQGRKTTAKQTVGKTKRSTTPKAKQIASTQVKLTWESPQPSERTPFGIAVRFQQLEHELTQLKSQANQISQQSVEIQTEMEALKTISSSYPGVAQQSALPPALEVSQRKTSGPSMPSFMQSSARSARSEVSSTQPVSPQSTQPSEPLQPVSSESPPRSLRVTYKESPSPAPQKPSQKPMAAATRATLKSLKNPTPTPSRRRRSPLRHTLHRFAPSLDLPKQPIARLLDALLWTLAAAGLRIGLNFLVEVIPILALPIGMLMFVPAIIAAYLGFFVPRSSPVLLYRLLLVTLGLFVGGKL